MYCESPMGYVEDRVETNQQPESCQAAGAQVASELGVEVGDVRTAVRGPSSRNKKTTTRRAASTPDPPLNQLSLQRSSEGLPLHLESNQALKRQ